MKNPLTLLCSLLALGVSALLCSCASDSAATTGSSTPSYVCIETNSGRVLYAQNATEKRPIGMMANLATVVVAMDWVKKNNVSLDRQIKVPAAVQKYPKTNLLKLQPGETISLRDALYSAIMWDDSASALTVAYACGSSLSPGNPFGAFVDQMNRLAARLLMSSTKFTGPSGATPSLSSARDLALLGSYAVGDPDLLTITEQRGATVTIHSASGDRTQTVRNNNRLLAHSEHVDGFKCGQSRSAGACLVVTARRVSVKRPNPQTGVESTYGQRLLVVILGMSNPTVRNNTAAEFLSNGWAEWDRWLPTNDYKDTTKFITLPN